ncbi:GL24123 [Drosophila persimilis]|uniref:GL24123 n=1 Tax=Drosophila persimilis TaxID=7234 RepID=B4G3R7_DROPE|nr:GL24123 [Drosophila persimilis]
MTKITSKCDKKEEEEQNDVILDGNKCQVLVGRRVLEHRRWSTGDIDQDWPEPQPRQGRALHPPATTDCPNVPQPLSGELAKPRNIAVHAIKERRLLFSTDVGSHQAIIRARVNGNEHVELEEVTALDLDQQSDIPCVSNYRHQWEEQVISHCRLGRRASFRGAASSIAVHRHPGRVDTGCKSAAHSRPNCFHICIASGVTRSTLDVYSFPKHLMLLEDKENYGVYPAK